MSTTAAPPATELTVPARVGRSKAQAKASYDRLSRYYEPLAGRFERRYRNAGLDRLCIRPGERVLEIGFGAGACVVAMARAVGEEGRVSGIDLSEGMLAVANHGVARAKLADRVELVVGDAIALPYRDQTFDAIFTSFTLDLIDTPELPIVVAECCRVLVPGGRLCAVAMAPAAVDSAMTALYAWAHRRFPNVVDCRPLKVADLLHAAEMNSIAIDRMSMWGLPVEITVAYRH